MIVTGLAKWLAMISMRAEIKSGEPKEVRTPNTPNNRRTGARPSRGLVLGREHMDAGNGQGGRGAG